MTRTAWFVAALLIFAPASAWGQQNTLTEEEKEAGWTLLFDGKTTERWRGYKRETVPPGWKVIEGVLSRVSGGEGGKGAGGGDDIMTREKFESFELKLDWKVVKGGNSGVVFHVSEDAPASWRSGPEMQILDDSAHPRRTHKHYAGACYDLYAPAKDVDKPPGEWNRARLLVNGNHVEHWLNGEKVVEYEMWSDDWNKRLAASKFKNMPRFAKNTTGYICLQDHTKIMRFRNIKIRRISGKK